jgi:pyruvate-ferredoxin/flavodoxin oxidoreductase
MVPLAEYVDLPEDEREGLFPYIWALDKKNHLMRIIPAEPVVKASEVRKNFWRMLRSLAGVYDVVDPEAIKSQVRAEMTQKLATGLMQLALGGGGADLMATLTDAAPAAAAAAVDKVPTAGGNGALAGDYQAPWIDSSQCTACDECVNINPKIFAYNDKKQAYVKDPKGGPYKDLVRAAEKCTAQVIHPGLPADRGEKGVDKLIKRAEKYNQ